MTLRWEEVVVDCRDQKALARWWLEALGWEVLYADDDETELRNPEGGATILFGNVPEPKTVKNRLHFDFVPDDQDAEVARLLELGAARADVGQTGDESWVVLTDPEGNEFCVLSAR
jgi:predicted enzyme related to lactoylglutathione lyase